MLNYIKSEWYKTTRGKGVLMAAAILSGLVLFMNIGLALAQRNLQNFQYGTFRFSLNNFISSAYIMLVMGAVVSGCVFLDDRRSGVMKNTVSYGISREKIFLGKCIIAFFFTFLVLCAVTAVYMGSAYLLLDDPEWLPAKEMLMAIAASLPSAAGALILMMLLGSIYEKELTAAIWWAVIYYIIPMVCSILGLRLAFFAKISAWMPYNFLSSEAVVTMTGYECLWDTPEGFAGCMISGLAGIVIFTVFGIWRFRKQEF